MRTCLSLFHSACNVTIGISIVAMCGIVFHVPLSRLRVRKKQSESGRAFTSGLCFCMIQYSFVTIVFAFDSSMKIASESVRSYLLPDR